VNPFVKELKSAAGNQNRSLSDRWLKPASVVLLLVSLGGSVPQAHERAPAPRAAHVDVRLAGLLADSDDDALERVIIKMKPGTKDGLVRALRLQGVSVDHDFNIIEGFSGRMPRRLLRLLQNHPDVVSMSTDAEMMPAGVTTSVSGTALNSAYSLRSTLGLQAVSATAVTKTFQQGVNSYTAAVSGSFNSSTPTTGIGTTSKVMVQDGGSMGVRSGMLLRFDGLFGAGANQIPIGATITSATLWLKHPSDGASTATAGAYRMLVPWDQTTTWNSLATSGPGLQRDNIEAATSADALAGLAAGVGAVLATTRAARTTAPRAPTARRSSAP